jgi:dimeric dUTPase (all-alpha-NTP-PPase superfamily)
MEHASERSITCSCPYCAWVIRHGLNRWCWVSALRLMRSIWTTLSKLFSTGRIFNFWFHHISCNSNCLAYETCLCRGFILHISTTVKLNLYNIIDLKWEPPASKQNSHFLKIFFDAWQRACLEILHFLFGYYISVVAKSVNCPILSLTLLVPWKMMPGLMQPDGHRILFRKKGGRVIMRALIAILVRVKEVILIAWGFVVTPSSFAWAVYAPTCCKLYTIWEKYALSDFIFVQH